MRIAWRPSVHHRQLESIALSLPTHLDQLADLPSFLPRVRHAHSARFRQRVRSASFCLEIQTLEAIYGDIV